MRLLAQVNNADPSLRLFRERFLQRLQATRRKLSAARSAEPVKPLARRQIGSVHVRLVGGTEPVIHRTEIARQSRGVIGVDAPDIARISRALRRICRRSGVRRAEHRPQKKEERRDADLHP